MKKVLLKQLLLFSAFTLAEVLIVIGIIGIVAEMTIPSLIKNINNSELKALWKEDYAILSSAAKNMSLEYPQFSSELDIVNEFGKYIKYRNICDTNLDTTQGCWQSGVSIYKKTRTTVLLTHPGGFGGGASCITLANGGIACFDSGGHYVVTYVDVNGSKKPNTTGKDVFAAIFDTYTYNFKPAQGYLSGWGASDGTWLSVTEGDGTCDTGTSDSYNWGCSYAILTNSN